MCSALVKGFFLNFFADFLGNVSNETQIGTNETRIGTDGARIYTDLRYIWCRYAPWHKRKAVTGTTGKLKIMNEK